MTKEEYEDFVLRYKGCGACFPMYHTLSRFEKMWFTAIQKDVAELEKENAELEKENKVLAQNLEDTEILNKTYEKRFSKLEKENAELTTKVTALKNANRAMVKELDDTTSGGLNILQNVVKNKEQLTKAKELIEELASSLSVVGECGEEECELINKAQKFINKPIF